MKIGHFSIDKQKLMTKFATPYIYEKKYIIAHINKCTYIFSFYV